MVKTQRPMHNDLAKANHAAAVLIHAAGKGPRLKSRLAKVLHHAGGRPLVNHVVRACLPLHAKKIIAVVGHQAEQVSASVEPLGTVFFLRQPRRSTRPETCSACISPPGMGFFLWRDLETTRLNSSHANNSYSSFC